MFTTEVAAIIFSQKIKLLISYGLDKKIKLKLNWKKKKTNPVN